jgi:RND family efflux transporter MFP subunit
LPDKSVSISPNIAGKITQVLVVPGQKVSKGQLIATLDAQQLDAQLQQAVAPTQSALNAVAQANIALDLALKNLVRTEALFEKDIVAQKDVVAARSQAELAKSQVLAAKAKVAEAEIAPAHIRKQLEFTKVRSPLAGVVAQRFLNIGSAADPSTPIVHIVNLEQVMVIASMPADSAANPKVGHQATITAVAEPGVSFPGKIQSISPVVDQNNNTVSIEVLTNNEQRQLKEGQQVTVSIATSSSKAVLVPETAIVPGHDHPEQRLVCVVKNGKLTFKEISAGPKQNGQIPVLKGLCDGDEIVSAGAYGVPDGAILDRGPAEK